MQWLAEPIGKRVRNQTFSDGMVEFCLSIKCLLGCTFERQVVELHDRVALLNRFSPLGEPDTVVAAGVA